MSTKKTYLYYPGCTLKTKSKNFDKCGINVMKVLGVDYIEYDDWQCCGAVYPLAKDDIASRLSAVRVLEHARNEGRYVLTMCSACHHTIKRVNKDMRENKDIRTKLNNYAQFERPYEGETEAVHFFEMLRDDIGFETLSKLVKSPLNGRKISAYYGCMLLRPHDALDFDNPENPSIIEDLLRALGAKPENFSHRNECCGAYMSLDNKELTNQLCEKIFKSCKDKDVTALITACPLCRYNLESNFAEEKPAVYYFTEILSESLGAS